MNTSLEFIRKAVNDMYIDKMDNMYESEISEEVYDFLVDKKEQIINEICEIFKENAIVNKEYCLRVLDGFTYDLIGNWDSYDEFEELDDLDDDIIDNCSTETMDEISYDALYNYDALWMTAVQRAFPEKVTDTQCGWGMIEIEQDERDEI